MTALATNMKAKAHLLILLLTLFFASLITNHAYGQQPRVEPPSTKSAKSEVVTLDAKPEPIAIDTAKTAVIVVDMENDFAAKGGMFDRAGTDISGAQKAIGPTAKVLATARQAG